MKNTKLLVLAGLVLATMSMWGVEDICLTCTQQANIQQAKTNAFNLNLF